MLTRGYFIGEIIDELANIAHQVDNRCKLGLTDLNKYLEDFSKEILNQLLELNLVNLNDQRSNAPGLDLGDVSQKKAFQITSQRGSSKINKTLEAIYNNKINNYNDIFVLIIGSKQKSYSLNSDLCKAVNFEEKDIWDINDLCVRMITLPINTLQNLYKYIKKEVVKVRIELEIPNEQGEYPTAIKNFVEKIPKPRLTDLEVYHSHLIALDTGYKELERDEIRKPFINFINVLAQLPRITREFYAFLLERKDPDSYYSTFSSSGRYSFNRDRLKRICNYKDMDGEIRLLIEHSFVDWSQSFYAPDDPWEASYLYIYMPIYDYDGEFLLEFTHFGVVQEIIHPKATQV
jgi:hypothetical protein